MSVPRARTDHVLDAPTLFLTRRGGSVAGFREWPWSARRLQPLSLVPRALLAPWRPPSAQTRTPPLQWDYNCFIGREKAQDKHFGTGRHPEACKCKLEAEPVAPQLNEFIDLWPNSFCHRSLNGFIPFRLQLFAVVWRGAKSFLQTTC